MGLINKTLTAYDSGSRYVINEGGTRSGKTFSVLSCLYMIASRDKRLISVVSETFPHLRKGAIRDFQNILQQWGVWNDINWSKTESTYTFDNGSQIEFFSVDSPGKVHGPARDILFINEAQNINIEIARHLFVRTTGAIFIDFNPTHEFWAHSDLKNDNNTIWINSTYLDNGYLTKEQVKEIERNKKNETWWRVYGLGMIGQVEGLVLPKWELIDEMPEYSDVVGMDFGYTNDPTAVVQVMVKDDRLYLNELVYSTGLRNAEIANRIKHAGVKLNTPIYADSAEPKSIDDLYLMGWNIHGAVKGADSIMWGIDLLKQYDIFVTKESVNLIKELRNYTYSKDKEGNYINRPIDSYNHAIDAVRYAVSMLQRSKHEYRTLDTTTNTRRL